MGDDGVTAPALQDRAEIEDLYARYMWALDTQDATSYAACFAPGARMYEVQPDGSVAGHDAVAFFEHGHADRPERLGHQHRFDNMLFSADPQGRPDRWQIRAYVFATDAQRNPAGATEHPSARTTWSGSYVDIVVKIDGAWRFEERNIAPWTGTLPERLAPAGG